MSNEQLEAELLKIEEDIKEICGEFDTIFNDHGFSRGEPNNFLMGLDGPLEFYDFDLSKGKKSNAELMITLITRWKTNYSGKAGVLQKNEYAKRIRELTRRIYADDESAEHIIGQLEMLDPKSKGRILALLEEIKAQCRKLMAVAASVDNLVKKLILRAEYLEGELNSLNSDLEKLKDEDLEKLKDDYYNHSMGVVGEMREIGKNGWRIVCKIYSEDKKAEHVFKKIKKQMLS